MNVTCKKFCEGLYNKDFDHILLGLAVSCLDFSDDKHIMRNISLDEKLFIVESLIL